MSGDTATKSNRGIVVAALIAGGLTLGVIATLVAVTLSGSGDETSPTTALLPDRTISTEGTMDDVTEFIETEDGRAVFFEGTGTVSLTFNTSGGSATGNLAVAMSGTDADGTEYVVTYTGVLSGTYLPSTAWFEGTLAITGDAPPGLEAAIPDVTAWDGGVVVTSTGCADSGKECVFGATQPDVVLYWEMPLPADVINPAYLEGIG